ncbi:Sec-independent protein translocase, TatC subunit [Thermaerobacter marianensis DSM 12885]|uniref:Sec-independent protein translocase protein TatC n=1 Tax=Thermaerobacter marianensis (strain ATCC 700841 / DSM 12885 / JCM 10246 / 7p75a) TaxID=644966 RepID=E6SMD5_THEM7|nr:twin-arginine translocase subunit TatC [Thermaerobacter marianensis]ADU51494.1 Sec-independent protein translocase, TatC subunit [Thermaerobacter marianensis DSM 12885]
MVQDPGEEAGGGIWPSLAEHLSELRLRIIYSGLAVAAGTAVGFVYAQPVMTWLIQRGPDVRLVALAPAEAFLVTLRIAVLLGLGLASPVLVYQALRFIWPGLTETERRYVRWYALPALVLFAAGLAFGLLVAVPMALNFLLGFNAGPIQRTLSVQAYVDFVTGMVWPFGFIFELPVVVGLLTEIGLLTPPFMAHLRKYALLVALVAAAFLTPTTDAITLLIFTAPLAGLYEVGYVLCWLIHRRRRGRTAAGAAGAAAPAGAGKVAGAGADPAEPGPAVAATAGPDTAAPAVTAGARNGETVAPRNGEGSA